MIRNSEPLVVPANTLHPEGRSRIAFFVGAMKEQPETMAALLRSHVTCDALIEAAEAIGPSPEEQAYTDTAIRLASEVFRHEDDRHIRMDPQTRTAVAEARAENDRNGSPLDPRIAAAAAVACQFASFNFYSEFTGTDDSASPPTEPIAEVVPLFRQTA